MRRVRSIDRERGRSIGSVAGPLDRAWRTGESWPRDDRAPDAASARRRGSEGAAGRGDVVDDEHLPAVDRAAHA